jgi:hypothetical protein
MISTSITIQSLGSGTFTIVSSALTLSPGVWMISFTVNLGTNTSANGPTLDGCTVGITTSTTAFDTSGGGVNSSGFSVPVNGSNSYPCQATRIVAITTSTSYYAACQVLWTGVSLGAAIKANYNEFKALRIA